ncbi:MAG: hypothetical protein FD189_2160 [Elusimicrobia bacterium]|nr:MAG: hypothetical protein FD154_2174 [Elusimicrobiota bacterium]KAF0153989.1 MAG: hypothetical protein FD189_2160 [Elusimicrobiota bacterium]
MKMSVCIVCFCLLAGPAAAAEGPYRDLAEKLSAPVGKKMKTVAVLPFGCAGTAGACLDGSLLGDRLTTELINLGKFTVIVPGQYAGELEKFAYRPEAGASPDLLRRLRKAHGADAVVTGMTADLGGGRSELNVRLVDAGNGTAVTAARAVLERDWAVQAEPRDLRSALRALAGKGVRATRTPEWAEFARMKAGSLATRLSIASLGGSEKMADFEVEAWKADPAEAPKTVTYFCASSDCEAINVTGGSYFKAYYPDGFVLLLDEAGDVLDCYYPERSYARLMMRLLARKHAGRNMVPTGDWDRFQEVMDHRYFPVPDKRDPDSLKTEIDKWKLVLGEKVTGIYSPETPDHPDFYKVPFADGFTLVFDGPSGAIESCEYPPPPR